VASVHQAHGDLLRVLDGNLIFNLNALIGDQLG